MGDSLKKVQIKKDLFEKLITLKTFVDNIAKEPDIALRGGVYKEIAEADVMTVKYDNWVIGYKVIPGLISNINRIFIKIEGYNIKEIPELEANPIVVTIFDVFLDRHQECPIIELIANDAFKIEQVVTPLVSRMPVIDRRNIQ